MRFRRVSEKTSHESIIINNGGAVFVRLCVRGPGSTTTASDNLASRVTILSRPCDFSNVMTFNYNKLWRPPIANRFSVTSQRLWPLATTNYGGLQPQHNEQTPWNKERLSVNTLITWRTLHHYLIYMYDGGLQPQHNNEQTPWNKLKEDWVSYIIISYNVHWMLA